MTISFITSQYFVQIFSLFIFHIMSIVYDSNFFAREKPEHIHVILEFRTRPCVIKKMTGKCELAIKTQIGKQYAHVQYYHIMLFSTTVSTIIAIQTKEDLPLTEQRKLIVQPSVNNMMISLGNADTVILANMHMGIDSTLF